MALFDRKPARRWLHVLLLAAVSLEASAALAQPNLRSTFPGRRIGGGTRGECAARVLAHLVPSDSVFAPGPALTVALLEGPTANPRPLQVQFRPQGPGGTAAGPAVKRELPAAPAGITLLKLASFKGSQVWESTFRCDDGAPPATNDPLSFVETVSPPALSLLVTEGSADDRSIQAALQKLKGLCGSQLSKAQLAQSFGLEDVIGADWPATLPVRCP
ncbi:hypothetical protein [Cyanobium sp. ATX 6F1]|uniref:hypothetical protein n=1 Tax=unclassified Cyanobium TaxID=2627006 RepID=UPI0020CD8B43|nr:hypothetical protein [Cyanobium sp. ATX 6F1]MCP9916364.1 hypothetical protein [Cyanobium sp. ATX 6F1]